MEFKDYSFGYKILGEGGSAVVYKGKKYKSKQQFAIKVIKEEFLKSEIEKRLLSNQIKIHQSLTHHENILNLIEHGKHGKNYVFVLQYCEKGSLADILQKNKCLSETEAIYITKQILKAYRSMFQMKILHRDIKPANVLITSNNEIKLCDFGFAIKASECYQNDMVRIGTSCFMAPQVVKQNIYTYKADVWSIGITFFKMITGQLPYKSINYQNFLKQIKQKPIQKLIPESISFECKNFLVQTLNPNYQQRMSSLQLFNYTFQSKSSIYTLSECKSQRNLSRKVKKINTNNTNNFKEQSNFKDNQNLNRNVSMGNLGYNNKIQQFPQNQNIHQKLKESPKKYFMKTKLNQVKTACTQASQINDIPKQPLKKLDKQFKYNSVQLNQNAQDNSRKVNTDTSMNLNSHNEKKGNQIKALVQQMQKITQIVISQVDFLGFCTKINQYLQKYFENQFLLLQQYINLYVGQNLQKLKSLSFVQKNKLKIYNKHPLHTAWFQLIDDFDKHNHKKMNPISNNQSKKPLPSFKLKDLQDLLLHTIRQIYLQFDKSIKSVNNCGKILTLDYLICLKDLISINNKGQQYFMKNSMINIIMQGFQKLNVKKVELIEDIFVGISKKLMSKNYF